MTREEAERWMSAHGIGYYLTSPGRTCPKVRAVMALIEQSFAEGVAAGRQEAARLLKANSIDELDSWIVGPKCLIHELEQPAAPAGVPPAPETR